jgi:endonuclease/exonuclease/phosphatase (EEP) superfamily protein YafD
MAVVGSGSGLPEFMSGHFCGYSFNTLPKKTEIKVMPQLKIGLLVIGLIDLTLSLCIFIAWRFPWELISHFRLQYWAASILLCAISLSFKRSPKPLFWLSLLLISVNTIALAPWYFPHTSQTKTAPNLRILSANVNIRNDRYAPAIAMVQQQKPDIALFIETTEEWIKQLDTGIQEQMPYHFFDASSGLALWSRYPLQNAKSDRLGSDNFSLLATVQVGERSIQLIGIHFVVPLRQNLFEQRNQQLNGLSQAIQKRSTPTIIIGDFNLTPWSPYYSRLIQQTHLHNAQLGFGIHPTYPQPSTLTRFPGWIAPLLQIPIDHALVTPEIRIHNFYTVVHGNADHAAIVGDFVVPGS